MKRANSFFLAILFILILSATAWAGSVTYSWTAPTHWNTLTTCPPGPSGEPITDPISYYFKWGLVHGGPYPNLITTTETSVTFDPGIGPEGGSVYGIVSSVVLGRESCTTQEVEAVVSPFLPARPNPPTGVTGAQR